MRNFPESPRSDADVARRRRVQHWPMANGATQPGGRKILVAYYSLTGSTARVARDIAARTGADIESIRDPGHGVGFFGFLKDTLDALRGVPAKIGPLARRPGDYAFTIIGTPVWARSMTPAVRAYLEQIQAGPGKVAFFVTSGNTDAAKVVPSMEKLAHTRVIASAGFNAQELHDQKLYEEKLAVFLKNMHLRDAPPDADIAAQAYTM
jgi:flavodoxin